VKDLYNESDTTLKKEYEDTRRWKDYRCSRIDKVNIVKVGIVAKEIYRFNVIPINISMSFFTEIGKSIMKFTWKHKKILSSQSNPSKTVMLEVYNTKLQIIRTMVIKPAGYWQKTDTKTSEQNRILTHSTQLHLIFDKVAKTMHWRKTASL
jgi:hypothetical protein